MSRFLPVVLLAVLVAGCDVGVGPSEALEPPATVNAPPPAPVLPPVEGFAHQAGAELFGYYFPASEVRIGELKLSHLYLGEDSQFQAWEATNGRGEPNFAPMMFQFDDLASETIPNDFGGQTPEEVVRVLPDGYGVSDSVVRFTGQDPNLGQVVFEGVFVEPALSRARAGQEDELVLRGTLTIGEHIYEGQAFTWRGRD